MAHLAFMHLCGLTLTLKPREVINPFPDLSNFPPDSEDMIFIFSRLSNFNDMSNVTYMSLPFKFIKLPNNLRKVVLTDISNGIPCLFVILWPSFDLETQRGNQPIS